MECLKEVKERFRSHVAVDLNGCWIWYWTFCKGYASWSVDGNSVRVARWIYELLIGPIAEGYELHHTCFVKACVNPFHLKPMTHREHIREHVKFGMNVGIKNGNAKRTETEVLTIKFLYKYFYLPATQIAKAMGIPQRSVYSITMGENWNHLQLPDKIEIEKEMEESFYDSYGSIR